jgi:competence ComEA-like helix-hairpin-helix protein
VRAEDLNRHSIRLSVSQYLSALYQSLGLHPIIYPGVFHSPDCELLEFSRHDRIDGHYVNGAEIYTSIQWAAAMRTGFVLRFSIHGDFIRDRHDLGADLDHLPLWLTNQNPAAPTAAHTGNGVPGGEFISWFSYSRSSTGIIIGPNVDTPMMVSVDNAFLDSMNTAADDNTALAMEMLTTPGRISINSASLSQLKSIKGVGAEIAEGIINARTKAPIRDEASLMKVAGIGKSLMAKIRPLISFDDGE